MDTAGASHAGVPNEVDDESRGIGAPVVLARKRNIGTKHHATRPFENISRRACSWLCLNSLTEIEAPCVSSTPFELLA
jgi:hypothetical protein